MTSGWESVALGDVLKPVSRPERLEAQRRYKLLGARWYAAGMFLKGEKLGAEIQATTLYRVERGDFVYSRLFAWKGSFAIASSSDDGCFVSNEFPCFHPDLKRLDPEFLRYYFSQQHVWLEALGLSSGSTPTSRNRLKESQLLSMRISLPPLKEQRRIVARVEALAARIEEARGLRGSVSQAISVFKSSRIKSLLCPMLHWKNETISECARMTTGTTPPTERTDYYGGKLPWFTPGDLARSSDKALPSKFLSQIAVDEGKARLFEPNTVLMVGIGASIGKISLIKEISSANQQLTGIKFREEIIPEFGFWLLFSLYDQIKSSASQATLPIINQKKIGKLLIGYPNLEEQSEIIKKILDLEKTVFTLEQLQTSTRLELDALLPAVLAKAFAGEL